MKASKKIEVIKYLLEIVLMTVLFAMMDNVGGMKTYLVLLIACVIFFALGMKKKWSIEALIYISIPAASYILLGAFSALISVNAQTTTIKVILYWLVPLVFAFSLFTCYGENMSRIVNAQFLGNILAYGLFDAPYFAKIFQWESVYAFSFGIFALYYAYKRKWGFFAIAVLFVFFAEKRIALLAVFAALFVMGIVWLFQQNKKLVAIFWGLVVSAIYMYLYLIYSGIMEAFVWGANINTNGRVEIYSRMANEFSFSPLFLGKGIGVVENLLECWHVLTYSNLHNDLLKFYIELGFVGFLLFLCSYGLVFILVEKRFGKPQMNFFFGIILYTVVLWATDNVSIYIIYLIPLYSTMFAVLSFERTNWSQLEEINDKENDGQI